MSTNKFKNIPSTEEDIEDMLNDLSLTIEEDMKSIMISEKGKNLFHFAVAEDSVKMIEALIKQGVDPNVIEADQTPLMLAIESKNIDVITALLQSPLITLDIINSTVLESPGGNLFHLAAEHKSTKMIEALIKKGVDPNIKDDANETPLMIAVEFGNIDVINALLQSPSITLDSINNTAPEYGGNLFHFAVEHQNTKMIEALIKKGANINAKNENNKTPLMLVVESGNIDVVNALLQSTNIEHDLRSSSGESALKIAIESGNIDVVNALLQSHLCDITKNEIMEIFASENLTKTEHKSKYEKLLEILDNKPVWHMPLLGRNATTESLFHKILTASLHSTEGNDKKDFLNLAKKVYTYKRDRDKGRPPKHSKLIKETIKLINLCIKGDMTYKDASERLTAKIKENKKYKDLEAVVENPLLSFQDSTEIPSPTEPKDDNGAPPRRPSRFY